MKSKRLNESPATYAVVFEKGDEFVSGLTEFARDEKLSASQITAIGAFQNVTLGYFHRDRQSHKKIPIHEQVEVLSLIGDISLKDGEPTLHAHVVVGKSDGTAHGGHVLEAHVWPTLEVIVTELAAHLRRRHDEATGLSLIDPAIE